MPQLPFSLIKFAVVNQWRGEGTYQSEVRILTPDRQQFLAASQPTRIELMPGGFAGNISFFVSITFPVAGQYWVQTLIDSNLFDEQPLTGRRCTHRAERIFPTPLTEEGECAKGWTSP